MKNIARTILIGFFVLAVMVFMLDRPLFNDILRWLGVEISEPAPDVRYMDPTEAAIHVTEQVIPTVMDPVVHLTPDPKPRNIPLYFGANITDFRAMLDGFTTIQQVSDIAAAYGEFVVTGNGETHLEMVWLSIEALKSEIGGTRTDANILFSGKLVVGYHFPETNQLIPVGDNNWVLYKEETIEEDGTKKTIQIFFDSYTVEINFGKPCLFPPSVNPNVYFTSMTLPNAGGLIFASIASIGDENPPAIGDGALAWQKAWDAAYRQYVSKEHIFLVMAEAKKSIGPGGELSSKMCGLFNAIGFTNGVTCEFTQEDISVDDLEFCFPDANGKYLKVFAP